jgi:hypothetical protein
MPGWRNGVRGNPVSVQVNWIAISEFAHSDIKGSNPFPGTKLRKLKMNTINKWTSVPPTIPTVGMGATINFYSDSKAATVIQVSSRGNRIVLQQDKAIRVDNNGVSESQSYNYERDSDGSLYFATRRKDGRYRLVGSAKSGRAINLGVRREYYDFSF